MGARQPPSPEADVPTVVRSWLATSGRCSLYMLVDGAQRLECPRWITDIDITSRSLYEGPQAEEMSEVAPLVAGPVIADDTLEWLVTNLWGRNSIVLFSSPLSLDEVRRHFRGFLRVQTEDGQILLFRFYDPRVLRIFLPTCTPEEIAEFFGPVDTFFVEGEEPDKMLIFKRADTGLQQESIHISKR